MLEHHLQKAIFHTLAFNDGLRFSELKPEGIENKLFDYHLKAIIRAGLVNKNENGTYSLTSEGKRLGGRAFLKSPADLAESVLFLALRHKNGAWLLYRRLLHPLKDRVGFMHAYPNSQQTAPEAASATCLQKTGVNAEFTPLGSGFFHTYQNDELESFVHFTLLTGETDDEDITNSDDEAEYYWEESPDFASKQMIPNMKTLARLIEADEPFFVEEDLML